MLSLVAVSGLLITVASHCGAWALGVWASVVAARGLSGYGMWALGRSGFSNCGAWGSVVVAHGL